MQIISLNFCRECSNILRKKGAPVLIEWQAICELFAMGDELTLDGSESGRGETVHRYLEKSGFIISTETNSKSIIQIMPSYFEEYEGDYYFCAHPAQHQDEDEDDDEQL